MGSTESALYACPGCKRPLHNEDRALNCPACAQTYPVNRGIPDFLGEELARSADPALRRMTAIDRLAPLYETRFWYPLVLALYGGLRSPSLAQLRAFVERALAGLEGRVLDVACGPGTFGRYVASPLRDVFGIDVSKRMLYQGSAYAAAEGVSNLHFARARVQCLPFEPAFFDAVVCCGSLHLFPDTATALREMARVAKPAAVLSAVTFTAGTGGILKHRLVRDWSLRHQGLHVFDLVELERCLAGAGFDTFEPRAFGSILTFSARRRAA
jgi:SAM-dependent methyltransferase